MRRRGWWLIAVAAVLALALQVAVAAVLWDRTRPRLPALTSAVGTLDQAIAAVVAATGDSAAVTVSDVIPASSCAKSVLAKGSRYTRTADLYTTPGSEDTLIQRIAAALPAAEHPLRGSRIGGAVAPLTAQPAAGIRLQVIQIDQGWVAATAETDCRAPTRPPTAADPVPTAADPVPTDATSALRALLAGLGTTPASWHSEAVACRTGRITTVDALSAATSTGNLPARLAAAVPAGARRFASVSNRLAWRDNNTSIVIAASDDGTHITAQRTTTC